MSQRLLFLLLLVCLHVSGQYAHQNISLMSRFDDPSVVAEPVYGIRYQGCWGWKNPADGREYGFIGSSDGAFIVEVTDPFHPQQRDYVPGASTLKIWHELRTYQHYLYIISDGGGNHLQIADLNYLPDSVHLVYDSDSIFDSGHTLFIDSNLLYVAYVSKQGTPTSSMNVYSLADPTRPALLRRLDTDYPAINGVHDMFVYNDTVFASCGGQGLYVFRYDRSANQFTNIGSLTSYPDQGYNHSSFADRTHTTLYMMDEVPEALAVKVVDISDLNNLTVIDTFASDPLATPHNPYVIGDELYCAYYQDGVQAFDISDPLHPVRNGFFDTHYQNPSGNYPNPAYQGCWGVFTDLPSGHLLASDMQLGLFVLDVSGLSTVGNLPFESDAFLAYPNPATNSVTIKRKDTTAPTSVELMDADGRIILHGSFEPGNASYRMETEKLAAGIYRARTFSGKETSTLRIAIIK